jgi:hypothetical protein
MFTCKKFVTASRNQGFELSRFAKKRRVIGDLHIMKGETDNVEAASAQVISGVLTETGYRHGSINQLPVGSSSS